MPEQRRGRGRRYELAAVDRATVISMAIGVVYELIKEPGPNCGIARCAAEALNLVQLELEHRGEDTDCALAAALGWGDQRDLKGDEQALEQPLPRLDRASLMSACYWAASQEADDPNSSEEVRSQAELLCHAISLVSLRLERQRIYPDYDAIRAVGWDLSPKDPDDGEDRRVAPGVQG